MLYDLEVCCVTSQLRLTQDVGDQDHVTLPLIKCWAAEDLASVSPGWSLLSMENNFKTHLDLCPQPRQHYNDPSFLRTKSSSFPPKLIKCLVTWVSSLMYCVWWWSNLKKNPLILTEICKVYLAWFILIHFNNIRRSSLFILPHSLLSPPVTPEPALLSLF